MSWPAILATPAEGARYPVIRRIVVLLPAPLGPRNATTWPWGMEKDTSTTAAKSP